MERAVDIIRRLCEAEDQQRRATDPQGYSYWTVKIAVNNAKLDKMRAFSGEPVPADVTGARPETPESLLRTMFDRTTHQGIRLEEIVEGPTE